jgi:hypothetical protein
MFSKSFSRVLLSALLMLGSLVLSASASAAGTLDQQQTEGGGSALVFGPDSGHGAFSQAQTFTDGRSGGLDQVDLRLERELASGPLTVEIRNVAGGAPGPAVLASASVPAANVPTSEQFVAVPFASPAPVVAGTRYAIVVYTGGSNRYYVASSQSDGSYPAGTRFFTFTSPPVTWTTVNQEDLAFKTYVSPTPACPAVAPNGLVGRLVYSLGQTLNAAPLKQLACSLSAAGL